MAVFDVILLSDARMNILAIKEIRALSGQSLQISVDIARNPPRAVLKRVPRDEAERARAILKQTGVCVMIREREER